MMLYDVVLCCMTSYDDDNDNDDDNDDDDDKDNYSCNSVNSKVMTSKFCMELDLDNI